VVGFPCNQFGSQEPGTAEEIESFARERGVTFPLMAKVDVNGTDAAPLFAFLRASLLGSGMFGGEAKSIRWNWNKFLVASDGTPVAHFGASKAPLSFEEEIVAQLERGASSPGGAQE
jgi:glutathione peroxidase-family protein